MKKYEISIATNHEYDGFLLCLSFEGILSCLEHIETEPLLAKLKHGTLLIDQLLVTGNGQNRYVQCRFHNGKLDLSSFKNATPDNYYKQLSLDLLRNNIQLLQNSILTDTQKAKIADGIIF